MSAIRKQARHAGLLYLAMAVIAPIGLLYVPGKLIVRGDAAATADLIRGSESLFRIGIASELLHQSIGVFLTLALYHLLKGVSHRQAILMAVLSLTGIPIMFLNSLNSLAALTLVGGPEFLSVFDQPRLDALAYLFLRLHGQGINVASVFWGLWLIPFGLLVIRSGFIPRVFGYLLWIAGAGYLASAFTTLVLPQYASPVGQVAMILEIAEVPIVFWLAIWGARERTSAA